MRPLVWFRTDLRVRDNPALHAAAASATRGVVALYVISPKDWERHDDAPVKVDFILRNLRELSKELEARNIALLVETAAHFSDVPALVLEVATKHGCDALHFNRDYEVNERDRDEQVERLFLESGRKVLAHDGGVALAPGSVLTNDGGFYTVYSPFKRKWRERFDALGRPEPLPICTKQAEMVTKPGAIPERVKGFGSSIAPDEWPAGEAHAKRRMESFLASRIDEYKDRRDFPGVNGTSTISPYLTSGVVSARQVIHAAMGVNHNKHDSGKNGVVKWIEEVVWREFYKHMLIGFPRLSKHRPLQLETERIRWKTNDEHLRAWMEGRTGYPMVDAAMRQLTRRGWMHNRVRMITAAFLSKDLFLDWREGERWFMRNLVDGDLANNNGGWQWSASVGADAQPYFRVFNPTSQGERFDPEGDFVREYVEELRDVDTKEIHDPSPLTRERCGYPAPVVDHAKARDEAIETFKKIKKS
jgi:deoxyribodipyrimidine photo-lyase